MSRYDREPNKNLNALAVAALGGLAIYQTYRRHQAEQRLKGSEAAREAAHHKATHDELTGLLNVAGLKELLEHGHSPRAVLYVDGTNQKAVNDKLGHDRGDQAIIGTAEVLTHCLRPNDVAARIGGDEFIVLLEAERRSDEGVRAYVHPTAIIEPVVGRIHRATQDYLSANSDLRGVGFDIAVGGAVWESGMDIDDMRLAAEQAMYEAKDIQHKANGQHRDA